MTYRPGLYVVIGLGKTGLACARFLAKHNLEVVVNDTRQNPPALAQLQQEFPQIQVKLGGLDRQLLSQAVEIIVSPGISIKEPAIAEQIQRGIAVVGDIELLARETKVPIIAITGTNAKSTVTTLVGDMAKASGKRVKVGGNLGTPVLDLLDDSRPELFVLELSSFQLETTHSLKPAASTILNITPDHMDRYADLDAYVAAKQRIYNGAQIILINRDDPLTQPLQQTAATIFSFGLNEPKTDHEFGLTWKDNALFLAQGDKLLISAHELLIQGQHNWVNALAALALGHAMHFPLEAMLKTLREFRGLSHRCEWVAEHNGVIWYNDSKGTNIGATIAAIEGLAKSMQGKLILIAGGQGKGADFSLLRDIVTQHVRAVVLIGEDAKLIEQALAGTVKLVHATDMKDAVDKCKEQAQKGDAVLLSPACASFDMFKNFEHRGEVFSEIVKGSFA